MKGAPFDVASNIRQALPQLPRLPRAQRHPTDPICAWRHRGQLYDAPAATAPSEGISNERSIGLLLGRGAEERSGLRTSSINRPGFTTPWRQVTATCRLMHRLAEH